MQIIALTGKSSQGKSKTLNIVYQFMLLHGFNQVKGHFEPLGDKRHYDFMDILKKGNLKVGIATMGDFQNKKGEHSGQTVEGLITQLSNKGCNKIICACRSSLKSAIKHIKSHPDHIIIEKTSANDDPSRQRIVNGEDAERICKLI